MSEKTTDSEKGPTLKGIIRAYQKVFKSKEGKMILADLEKVFQTNTPAFIERLTNVGEGGQSIVAHDPLYAAIKDGTRMVVLHIESRRDEPVSPDDEESGKKQVKVTR